MAVGQATGPPGRIADRPRPDLPDRTPAADDRSMVLVAMLPLTAAGSRPER